jgi:chaperonin GroEL (HSP60 family)
LNGLLHIIVLPVLLSADSFVFFFVVMYVQRANELVKAKVHPTSVMAGYRLALKEAVKFIKNNLTVGADRLDRSFLIAAAKTSMSSKIIGGVNSDFFSNMVVDAMLAVKRNVDTAGSSSSSSAASADGGSSGAAGGDGAASSSGAGAPGGEAAADGAGAAGGVVAGSDGSASTGLVAAGGKKEKYPVSAINVIKCHGRSATESMLVNGFALPHTRAAQQMPKIVRNAKIAMLDIPLQRHRMALGVQIVVTDPAKLEAIRQREADITKEKIKKIIAAGANVILTTKTIDDLCMKYLVEAGVMGIRRVKKQDLKKLAQATGGSLVINLADLEGGETFDASSLGKAEEVSEERVGDGEMIFIRGTATSKSVSIVLRVSSTNS